MRQPYNVQDFLDSIADMSLQNMILTIVDRLDRIDGQLFPGRGRKGINKQHRELALYFKNDLTPLLFFLRTGIKPNDITQSRFESFKPLIEKLVEKGEFKLDILELFEN